jgi:hypothetical protein
VNTASGKLLLAAWVLAAPAIAFPQETTNAPATPAVSAEQNPLPRDPFWPVGWTPPKLGPVAAGTPTSAPVKDITHWDDARKLIQVTGMSRTKDGKYLAILKGIGVAEEGDTVSITYMGLVYRWKIKSITSKGLVPERIGVYPTR